MPEVREQEKAKKKKDQQFATLQSKLADPNSILDQREESMVDNMLKAT